MKKILTLILVIAVAATMAIGLASCKEESDEFIIGFSGPLTGGASVYGEAVRNAAQMAVDEINANGGLNGVKFKLVAVDDMHNPDKISTNYASLYEGGMHVSLGTVTTAPGLEFANLSMEDNVFFLTPSASGDDIPKYDNGYQMCFADGNQGKVAAGFVNENYAGQTIGIFYKSDDPYSQGIYKQFKENLDQSITTIDTVFTDANTSDFKSQIDTLKDCKFIFMPIYYTPASLFMTQAKTIVAPDAVYYGCDGFDGIASAEGFKIATIPQEVSMLSHFNSNATEGRAKEFIDKYVAKYGKETLNQFGASAYDCVYAIYEAMKIISEKNPDAVSVEMSASDLCELLKSEFQSGFTFTGVTGENITWDANGYVKKDAVKFVVKHADSVTSAE